MNTELQYVTFVTDLGWIGVMGSVRGLLRTTLPQPSVEEARCRLGERYAAWSPHRFEDLKRRLRSYFIGQKVDFTDRLDLSRVTAFQRRALEATRIIPYGETRSYRWVAERMGMPGAARAVGQALSINPLPVIIPCHRVLARSGELAGFSGGIEMKKHLLSQEAAASTG